MKIYTYVCLASYMPLKLHMQKYQLSLRGVCFFPQTEYIFNESKWSCLFLGECGVHGTHVIQAK